MRTSNRSKFQRSSNPNKKKDYNNVYRRSANTKKTESLTKKVSSFFSIIGLIGIFPFKLIALSIKSIREAARNSNKNKSAKNVSPLKQADYVSKSNPRTQVSSRGQSKLKSHTKDATKSEHPWYEEVITKIESHPLSVYLSQHFKRVTIIQIVFVMIFGLIVWRFADLQVTSSSEERLSASPTLMGNQIILASRGQIFFKDISQSKSDIPLTTTVSLAHVYFDAAVLKEQINKKIITLEQATMMVASALNISYGTIFELFKTETAQETASKYVLITKFVNSDQKKAVEYLRYPTYTTSTDNYIPPFSSWLNFEPIESRYYPQNELLAQTVGYVPRSYATRDDALNAGCKQMVNQNESRHTVNTFIPGDYSKGQYSVGYYGIEQNFCSELAGLNGKKPLNRDLNTSKEEESRVQNGSDIYLTIDRNLQQEAETLLKKASEKEKPTDATILVMEVKTGKVLAMASYPTFNPNNYSNSDPAGFRNVATSGDYEAGSVIKPLTVASALNEWEAGSVDSQGNRIGVPPDWTFVDFDNKGKPYQENNGRIFYIRNSQGLSWKDRGPQNLSNVLRDSINTGIAEIQPKLGNEKTREYFEERFLFGQPTLIDLPGDTSGNVVPLTSNIGSPFSYATHGFGQGFTVSPIQLARAFTALANKGKIVEPILVDKIVHEDGTIETPQTPDSKIQQPVPQQVISETSANLITGYLVNTVDQGYLGARPSKGKVPGYTVAGKTGTAEVGRIPKVACPNDQSVYICNTNQGIYDHTYVGYGPASDPQVIIVIKFSEPDKGVVENFAENTTGPYFSEMMKYTLEYLGIPKEPGR